MENQTYAELIVEPVTTERRARYDWSGKPNNGLPRGYHGYGPKDLREHPAFADFTEEMCQSVDDWIAETDSDARRHEVL